MPANLLEQDDPRLQPQTGPSRPDFVPEKFWNARSGAIETEALARAYGELERKCRATCPAPRRRAGRTRCARLCACPTRPTASGSR
jgi:hypothetical protein